MSTLQVLFGYFVGCPVDRFASLSLPRHTVVQLTPNQYGWKVEYIPLGPPTHPEELKSANEISTLNQQHPSYQQNTTRE